MKKITFLFILLLIGQVSANVLSEKTFADLGESNFLITKDENLCKDYVFTNFYEEGDFVLNLKLDNYITPKENTNLDVYLNEDLVTTLKDEKIKEKNIIKLKNLKETNKLSICVDSKYLPRMIISNKSTLGYYRLAEFKSEHFYQKIGDFEFSNTMIPVEVYIKNTGSNKINIEIFNATDKFLKNTDLKTVSGNANFSGEIEAGEEKIIKYYIKVSDSSEFITPRAILKYKDEFGIERELLTEAKVLKIIKDELLLDALVDLDQDIKLNEKAYGKLILRNVSETNLRNIFIEVNYDGDMMIEKKGIDTLKKYDVLEIPFYIIKKDKEKAHLSFKINYESEEGNQLEITTKEKNVEPRKKTNFINEIITILLIISVLIYVWIVGFKR